MAIDLSVQVASHVTGKLNATAALQAEYGTLMAISDLTELQARSMMLVAQSGISPKNRAKFDSEVRGIDSLHKLRFYLTNYLMKGSGNGVFIPTRRA